MDSNLKAAAEELYEELGMNLSTAFNIFVRQSLRERGIPSKLQKELRIKKPSLLCWRQKGLQRILMLKVIMTWMNSLQILINDKV